MLLLLLLEMWRWLMHRLWPRLLRRLGLGKDNPRPRLVARERRRVERESDKLMVLFFWSSYPYGWALL
jgi:hypothetical protein